MKKQSFIRTLKLGPAIGDWTKVKFHDPSLSEVQISEVVNVNFDSLPREEMKELHLLHYRLAERISKSLAKDLDIKVEMHTVTAAQMTYQEFMQTQSEKVVQADYYFKDLGRVNVLFDWALADMIVNRLTGGKGDHNEEFSFSDIEAAILESQMEALKQDFSKVWNNIFSPEELKMNFSYGSYVYDKKFSLREAYIVFTFHLYFGKGDLTKLSWAYPNDLLRDLMLKKKEQIVPFKKRINLSEKTLSGISVPVKAELGKTTLKMKDLKGLRKGDVIPLDSFFDKPLEFTIGNTATLLSQPGILNQRIGLQILLSDQGELNNAPITISETHDLASDVVLAPAIPSVEIPRAAVRDMSTNSGQSREDVVVHRAEAPVEPPIELEVVDDAVAENAMLSNDISEQDVVETEPMNSMDDVHEDVVEDSNDEPIIADDANTMSDIAHAETDDDDLMDDLFDETEDDEPLDDHETNVDSDKNETSASGDEEFDDDLDFDDDFSWDDLDEDL